MARPAPASATTGSSPGARRPCPVQPMMTSSNELMNRAVTMKETAVHTAAATKQTLPGHLRRLEAESIEIIREVAAEFRNPVMLYSIGKDSSVMLHLAMKAFYPSLPPFPLLHV